MVKIKKSNNNNGNNGAKPAAVAGKPSAAKKVLCWKKILIFIFGVITGATICCLLSCNGHQGRRLKGKIQRNHPDIAEMFKFDDKGCLDLAAIECPDMTEKVKAADVNKDNCITKEELDAAKPEQVKKESAKKDKASSAKSKDKAKKPRGVLKRPAPAKPKQKKK